MTQSRGTTWAGVLIPPRESEPNLELSPLYNSYKLKGPAAEALLNTAIAPSRVLQQTRLDRLCFAFLVYG